MLYQIGSLLLDVVVGVLTGVCLLRLYMQWLRLSLSRRSGHSLGPFVCAMTDWLVLPLRRVVPAVGALDTASLLAAFLLQLAEFALLWLIAGAAQAWLAVPVLALFGLVRLAMSGMLGAVILYAVLSWVSARSPVSQLLDRLVAPILQPVRRFLPLVGGVDLSPLVVLLALQVAMIVLGHLQATVLLQVSAP